MKLFHILLYTLCIAGTSIAQVVLTDPQVPVSNLPVTIVFNAAQGNGELAGYNGEVYAHTGVITNLSTQPSNWRYVVSSWGVNTDETRMTRIGPDLYSLDITPSIREYYGVAENEDIEQLAFVFRSEEPVGAEYLVGRDGDGGDIFIDVLEEGLNIVFLSPSVDPVILSLGQSLLVNVQANDASKISLFMDEVLLEEVSGNSLEYTVIASDFETHLLKAVAENSTASVADSFFFTTRPEIEVAPLPEGVRDGINYIDEESVVLSLLAPGKEFVYVLGDFNTFMVNNNHYMKMTPDGERFWLQINGLIPGWEYAFQYYIDGELRIADPYSDKILDPFFDEYISEETYPGLKAYPLSRTFGQVSVFQTNQEPYQWVVEQFETPAVTDLVIYELLVRDFTDKHAYEGVIEKLDYLEDLGVNAIELMPVNEFEMNSSWGYNPSFYFAPDKYYGPKNELKRLIDECHQRGIAVIMDMVLNHSYGQSPLVQMYMEGGAPAEDNPWYNREHNFANTNAHWGFDFNHESPYTEAFVDSVLAYWMNEYHFDGYRLDFTKGFSNTWHPSSDEWGSNYDQDRIDNLKRIANAVWDNRENAILILEHLAENLEDKVLANFGFLMWGNMNNNYAEASMGYHDSNKSDLSGVSYKKRGWTYPHLVGYMESHDEERIMYKNVTWGNSAGWSYNIMDTSVALSRIRLISAFFYTVPGPKMIWQFGELGYDYSIDYNGRLGEKPVRWDYYDDWRRNYNYKFISSLIALTKEQDVFETPDFEMEVATAMKSIRLFGDSTHVVIAGNFDITAGTIQPVFSHTGLWFEYFSGDTLDVSDPDMVLELLPGEYRLYSDRHFGTPDIGTGIGSHGPEEGSGLQGYIYPNPAADETSLHFKLEKAQQVGVSLFNMHGKQLLRMPGRTYSAGSHRVLIDTAGFAPGLYLCVVHTKDGTRTLKFIRN